MSVEVDVPITDDTTYEADEGFTLDLSSPYNASIADAQGAGTITNDDALPSASIADVSVAEGASGTTPANFTVSLSNPSAFSATVHWATADGTATAGSDYTAGSGTLTFDPGVTSMPVSVDVTGDTAYEPDETFSVTLSSPTGSTVGTPSATGTITNDDKAVTTLTPEGHEDREEARREGRPRTRHRRRHGDRHAVPQASRTLDQARGQDGGGQVAR